MLGALLAQGIQDQAFEQLWGTRTRAGDSLSLFICTSCDYSTFNTPLSNTYSSFATITNLGVDDKGRRCDGFYLFGTIKRSDSLLVLSFVDGFGTKNERWDTRFRHYPGSIARRGRIIHRKHQIRLPLRGCSHRQDGRSGLEGLGEGWGPSSRFRAAWSLPESNEKC